MEFYTINNKESDEGIKFGKGWKEDEIDHVVGMGKVRL